MMKKFWEHIKNYTTAVVSVAVVLVAFNSVVNGHYHVTESGYILWHAHPHSDSSSPLPYKSHSHSDYELTFLQLLTNLLSSVLVLAVIAVLFPGVIQNVFCAVYSEAASSRIFFNYSLRGPPVSVN